MAFLGKICVKTGLGVTKLIQTGHAGAANYDEHLAVLEVIRPPSKPLYEAFGSNYNQIGRPWCQTIGN